jgi:hypothetical protein
MNQEEYYSKLRELEPIDMLYDYSTAKLGSFKVEQRDLDKAEQIQEQILELMNQLKTATK